MKLGFYCIHGSTLLVLFILLFYCIHGSTLLVLFILLFIERRKQVIAIKCQFSKIFKWESSEMKFLKLLPFKKFNCALDDIFLKFCDQNWTFYRRNRHQSGQTSNSTLIFGIHWIEWILSYQFTTTSICHQHIVNVSDKLHKYTICGVGTSKLRPNQYELTIKCSLKFA